MNLYNEWVQQLKEDQQQKTAFERTTHTVVIAGPGSGKTRVLALKIAQLLRDEIEPPRGIACLTYTRNMAKELENRLYSLGISDRPNVVINTVHGFCLGQILIPFADLYDLLLPKPIRIAPSIIQNACLDQAFHHVVGTGKFKLSKNSFNKSFNKYRRQRADQTFDQWKDNNQLAEAIRFYEGALITQGYVDFDLIVQAALRLIINEAGVRQYLWAKFPWFAVDEYQDLGYPLYRIVTELIERTEVKLFAIGDPDQSIFDFAGTDPKYLVQLSKMEKMQPKVELDINYRSTQEIIKVAQVILGQSRNHHSDRHGGSCKIIECPRGINQQADQIVKLIKLIQRNKIKNDQIAVFHRIRSGLNTIAKALEHANIDYVIDKNNLYDRQMVIIRWLEDLAFWCLKGFDLQNERTVNPRSTFEDLLNTWLEFGYSNNLWFNKDTNHARIYLAEILWNLRDPHQLLRDWLERINKALDLNTILGVYEDQYPDEVNEYKKLLELITPGNSLYDVPLNKFANALSGVQLTTIHSSKGTEYDVVIIAGVECVEKSLNGHRLLYVGATRARNELYLLYTQQPPHPHTSKVECPIYISQLDKIAQNNDWKFLNHYIAN
jgi:DNA helicase-2/ATP-dependent DNA helicase PcrA